MDGGFEMNRRTYGMIAGIAGAAFAWWMRKRQSARAVDQTRVEERGEVIFTNAPIV